MRTFAGSGPATRLHLDLALMRLAHSIAGIVGAALIAAGSYAVVHNDEWRQDTARRVDFSRDIRPIFNQSCVSCHGGVRQKNGVSFIYRDEALGKGRSGRATIVPGHPEASELIARVTTSDPEARMPYHAPPLSPAQIALLRQWVKEGAQWEEHWAFVPPEPQPLPEVRDTHWPQRPFDRFILARLENQGLHPSPEAAKTALLRRVSFDLTGLPPTPEELSNFLADTSANAYEKQVDRLLASPHYGERWTAMWLDLARYADSRGYEQDPDRPMWPYRDWLIRAFNRNLPYDQLVITQLAGDLLPNATLDDQIATAFHRLTPVNDEGGTDDEEFRLVAVMDRVATTWSVLNGVTINCVQCHSHPYDPIRHAEYYKFLAFFNTSRDSDLTDDAPTIPVPNDPARYAEVAEILKEKAELSADIVQRGRSLAESVAWSSAPIETALADEALGLERKIAQFQLGRAEGVNPRDWVDRPSLDQLRKSYDEFIADARSERQHLDPTASLVPLKLEEGAAVANSVPTLSSHVVYELSTEPGPAALTALRIEVAPVDPTKARHTPEDGFIVNQIDAWLVSASGQERKIPFRYFAPDSAENLAIELKAVGDPTDHPLVSRAGGGLRPALGVSLGDRTMPVGVGEFTSSVKLFQTRWTIAIPATPLRIEPGSHLEVQLTQLQTIAMKPALAREVKLSTSADERWTRLVEDPAFVARLQALAAAEDRLEHIPSTPLPVMAEEAPFERRQTLEFERGNFLTKVGPVLVADVPALFPKLPANAPRTRLTLAKWFFTPGQPLTARVAVNRFWEQLFGTGIVETLEDFGSVGQPPSHPELLDWLALHFQNDLHWDIKALLRELVTSATYRQQANTTPRLLRKDPRNRLLAHGPQQRLTAEMIRDQALLAGGLLNESLGGPPVMPPQPAGLWMNLSNDARWVDATGPDRYRRAIYTYEKRSTPYPSYVTFDGPDHVVSLVRRIQTNTPLQALVTLNDPVYTEAAEAVATRVLDAVTSAKIAQRTTGAELLDRRLNYAAQCILSRDLSSRELKDFAGLYEEAKNMPSTGAQKDRSGNSRRRSQPVASRELSALTAVTSTLLNLDAALTR
jgi:mono/diheme cytochrome c family protein